MIFKAIIIPTPRRIRKYLENALREMNTDKLDKEFITNKELKHINLTKDSFKNYSITMKIF
ncbi:hypothetical protein [Clostridium nigeriense]|uniref:hypothetical protein n=1 Tax=Clostridium nigeriense TaxID=1805470 RepID=UPI00083197E0|nr:hypothetical protein [Clostridium nigeriense]